MNKKIVMSIVITLTITMTFGMSVFAAPKQMSDGQIFDPDFYAQTYPDVVAALGSNEEVLYQHYLNNGKLEGRQPYALGTDVSSLVKSKPQKMADGGLFDPIFYAQTYPDVVALLGTDANVLYNHYKTNGSAMGRLPYASATPSTPRLVGAYTSNVSYRKQTNGNYAFYLRTILPGTATVGPRGSKKIYGTYSVDAISVVDDAGYPEIVAQYSSRPNGNYLPRVSLDVLIYNEAGTLLGTQSIHLMPGQSIETETFMKSTLTPGTYYLEMVG